MKGPKPLYQLLPILILLVGAQAQFPNLSELLRLPNGPNLLPKFPNLPNLTNLPETIKELISKGIPIVKQLLNKELNFGDIAKGLKLTLNGKQLNSFKFKLDVKELTEIANYLYDFSFDDRMKVWGLMAEYANLFQNGLKEFDIKDLQVFEGDLVLGVKDIENLIEERKTFLKQSGGTEVNTPQRRKRKISIAPPQKWDQIINWYMDEKLFTKAQRTLIKDALDSWEQETCLSFIQHQSKPTGDYIEFEKNAAKDSCSSLVGRQAGGQTISLGDYCFVFGTVVHEIGHALGMWHEQSRPDRDLYIKIDEKNIQNFRIDQFQKRSWDDTNTEAIPYDFGSIMQYGPKFFTRNNADTMIPKSFGYEQTMGQEIKASFHDFKIINYRYCNKQCGHSLYSNICGNDGYLNPRNCKQCKCPDGFKTPNCKDIQKHTIASCGTKELRAMARWTTLSSPGYPVLSTEGECFWRISAPPGSRVELEFVDSFRLPSPLNQFYACDNYIEVRYRDLALTGPRFCGVNKPFKPIVSETESMVLLFRSESKGTGNSGFKVKYRIAECGGCKGGTQTQAACAETYRYTCQGEFKCKWIGRTKCFRENTCLKTVHTCCSGYRLDAKKQEMPENVRVFFVANLGFPGSIYLYVPNQHDLHENGKVS